MISQEEKFSSFLPTGPLTCLPHHLKNSFLQDSPLPLPTSHLTAAEGHCCISSLFHASKSSCHFFLELTAPWISRPFLLASSRERIFQGWMTQTHPVRSGMVLDTPTSHSSSNPAPLPADQAVTHTYMSNPPSQTGHLLQNVTLRTMGEKFIFLLFRHFRAKETFPLPHITPAPVLPAQLTAPWEHKQF